MEIYSHLARVSPLAQLQDNYQEKLRSLGFGEAEDTLFYFRAEISNTLLDSHFTHMSTKTLQNYVEDSNRGVSFLKGHDRRSLPVGYSVGAMLETIDTKQRVLADFYTVRGLQDTDDLIKRIQANILRDVSVGFHGGEMTCDICGQDFWECRHYPGIKFTEKIDGREQVVVSTFTIDDARLSEVSGVFDGSTPDAMILKAERAAKAGELSQEQVDMLEQRYRVKLPSASKAIFTVTENSGLVVPVKERKMEEKELKEAFEGVRTLVKVETEEEVLPAVRTLQAKVDELTPLADDGRQYRSDLIAEALSEGVRAFGNDFKKETYEGMLKSAPIATIRSMRDDWAKVAKSVLPSGRASVDSDPVKTEPKKEVVLRPDAAYSL